MPRPRRSDEPADKVITVRTTIGLHSLAQHCAERCGITLSEWIVRLMEREVVTANQALPHTKPPVTEYETPLENTKPQLQHTKPTETKQPSGARKKPQKPSYEELGIELDSNEF